MKRHWSVMFPVSTLLTSIYSIISFTDKPINITVISVIMTLLTVSLNDSSLVDIIIAMIDTTRNWFSFNLIHADFWITISILLSDHNLFWKRLYRKELSIQIEWTLFSSNVRYTFFEILKGSRHILANNRKWVQIDMTIQAKDWLTIERKK